MTPEAFYYSEGQNLTFVEVDPMDVRPAGLYSEADASMYMQSAVFLPALRALNKVYPRLQFYFEFEAACRVHAPGWDDITGQTDFVMWASEIEGDLEQVPIFIYEAKAPGAIRTNEWTTGEVLVGNAEIQSLQCRKYMGSAQLGVDPPLRRRHDGWIESQGLDRRGNRTTLER
jgi:hypothetical protein